MYITQWDVQHKSQSDEIQNAYASQGIHTWNTDSKPQSHTSYRKDWQSKEKHFCKRSVMSTCAICQHLLVDHKGQVGCNLNIFGFQHIEPLSRISWHPSYDEICLQGYLPTVFEKVSKTIEEKKSWKQPHQNDLIYFSLMRPVQLGLSHNENADKLCNCQ